MDNLKWIPFIKKTIKKYNCYLTEKYSRVLESDCVLCEQAYKDQRRAGCYNQPQSFHTCEYCIHEILTGGECTTQPTFKQLAKNHWISINSFDMYSNPLAFFKRRLKEITQEDKNMIQERIDFLKELIEKIKKESVKGEGNVKKRFIERK